MVLLIAGVCLLIGVVQLIDRSGGGLFFAVLLLFAAGHYHAPARTKVT